MKAEKQEDMGLGFLSIVAGVLVAIIIGAVLLTYIKPLFDKFFSLTDFNQGTDVRRNDIVLGVTLFCWLFIGSLSGGLACTMISNSNDLIHILISSLVSIALIFVVSGDDVFGEGHFYTSICILLSVPFGNLAGGWIGNAVKRRRNRPRPGYNG